MPASADSTVTPARAETGYGMIGLRQFRSELRLIFGRRRNLAMLVILIAVPIFIGIAVKVSTPRPGEGPPFVSELTNNGLFLAFTAMAVCLPVFLPLALAVVAGDAVAGEASAGTLRYLLSIPVSRTRLLVVKTLGVLAYLAAGILLITVCGLVAGFALFGTHGVTLLSGDTVSVGNGLARAAGVAAYVFVDLLGLAAIGLFFSTLTEVAVGAMSATVVSAIAFAVLDSVPQLGRFRDVLLTHNWLNFDELLRSSPNAGSLLRWSLLPLAYALVFFAAAWARITTADVSG
ncbi:MAG: type transport system permease protein [Nocardioidaceae bacterium]|jgi:ABC-2 type transport system permease protein|nr:type transport system permease protein [Nocardioidaceae bacterium]